MDGGGVVVRETVAWTRVVVVKRGAGRAGAGRAGGAARRTVGGGAAIGRVLAGAGTRPALPERAG